MGIISVIGGVSGLRLPETLHQRLPQTIEEGEAFGQDWTCADCCQFSSPRYFLVWSSRSEFDPVKNNNIIFGQKTYYRLIEHFLLKICVKNMIVAGCPCHTPGFWFEPRLQSLDSSF